MKEALFLDEIGGRSSTVQVKLFLTILQERQFERVRKAIALKRSMSGSSRPPIAIWRISHVKKTAASIKICTTGSTCSPFSLPRCAAPRRHLAAGQLLRSRSTQNKINKGIHRISTPAINMMIAYHWPGNIRKLENCVEYAVLLSDDRVISPDIICRRPCRCPTALTAPPPAASSCSRPAFSATPGRRRPQADGGKHQRRSTAACGISPRMVRYKVQNLDIDYQSLLASGDTER